MKATIHTNHGDINVTLFPNEAPKTVENFVGLANGDKPYRDDAGRTNPTPYFDGLTFHRIISGFMIQGGCPLGDGRGGPGFTFDDEPHPEKVFNKPYLLAMANAGKRMGKGTNGSQFFITVVDADAPAGQAHHLRRGRRRPEPRGRRPDRERAHRPQRPAARARGHHVGQRRQVAHGIRAPRRMTEPQVPTPDTYDQPPVCPRHPDRESWVRCQRCGRPTCPECQRPAAVGIQCVDCVTASARAARPTVTRFGGRFGTRGRSRRTASWASASSCTWLQLLVPSITTQFAFSPARGWDEPWRALTAAFLHSPSMILHIALNMLFLWQIGPYLEGLLGRARFVALYLLSAIGGSVGVVLLVPAPTAVLHSAAEAQTYAAWGTGVVGASGAVFGLFGALFVLNRRMGRSSAALYAVLAINVVIGFVYPGIAWQAHLGGLLTGAAGAAVIARLSGPGLRRWQLPALGLIFLLVVGAAALKYLGVPDIYR